MINAVNGHQFGQIGPNLAWFTSLTPSSSGSGWGSWFKDLAQGSIGQILGGATDFLSRKISGEPSAYQRYQYEQQLKYQNQQASSSTFLIIAVVVGAAILLKGKGGGIVGSRKAYRYSEEG